LALYSTVTAANEHSLALSKHYPIQTHNTLREGVSHKKEEEEGEGSRRK
jgi:hypothetical protein